VTSHASAKRRVLGGAAAGLGGIFMLLLRGKLTIDLGIGRRLRPLGPLTWRIEAPPEVVFEVISAPYLERTPRALESKLRVLELGTDMVLAEHFTRVGTLVATTLETVRFERPHRISFRLVRGPVPNVIEQFLLRETDSGTELEYSGELGTDLWVLGRWWGERVARRWEAAVRSSLVAVKAEAERRAARGKRGQSTGTSGAVG
jgi:Polyketide cyclase / dehydrase and lipid transport